MEKMVFVVRKALDEDVPQIFEITREAFTMYAEGAGISQNIAALCETYEDIKKDIETKEVFAALYGDKIVGSVRVDVNNDNTAYLSRLGVAPEHQKNGIGKILMNAVDNKMRELKVTNLYLHTASRLLSLVRFYYGRGFYIESTTKDRGYIRALLCKEYVETDSASKNNYEDSAAI